MDPERIREYRTFILLLAMSKRKSYCISFKLKAVETAEKNQKKLQQENLAWILREFELLAVSKHKSYCVSFKLKAVETAEKNQKKLQQENLAWILREFESTVH